MSQLAEIGKSLAEMAGFLSADDRDGDMLTPTLRFLSESTHRAYTDFVVWSDSLSDVKMNDVSCCSEGTTNTCDDDFCEVNSAEVCRFSDKAELIVKLVLLTVQNLVVDKGTAEEQTPTADVTDGDKPMGLKENHFSNLVQQTHRALLYLRLVEVLFTLLYTLHNYVTVFFLHK